MRCVLGKLIGWTALFAALSCGGKVQEGRTDAGSQTGGSGGAPLGGSGGTGGTPLADSCKEFCDKCAASDQVCLQDCQSRVSSNCGTQYRAYMQCVLQFNCSAVPCPMQTDAYSNCFFGVGGAAGAGGSSGAGGSTAHGGSGGGVGGSGASGMCESDDPNDTCSVCAASKCCAQWISCADDTGDPDAGVDKTCLDIWQCAAYCDAASFKDCVAACDGGTYNPRFNDFYTCVYVEQCPTACPID
jgi:hypothetical protein